MDLCLERCCWLRSTVQYGVEGCVVLDCIIHHCRNFIIIQGPSIDRVFGCTLLAWVACLPVFLHYIT